jgi:hypothetical protein
MVNDFELAVETKLDYQISYKEIHADLPSDPTTTYQEEWIGWNVFLDKKVHLNIRHFNNFPKFFIKSLVLCSFL